MAPPPVGPNIFLDGDRPLSTLQVSGRAYSNASRFADVAKIASPRFILSSFYLFLYCTHSFKSQIDRGGAHGGDGQAEAGREGGGVAAVRVARPRLGCAPTVRPDPSRAVAAGLWGGACLGGTWSIRGRTCTRACARRTGGACSRSETASTLQRGGVVLQ